MDRDAERLRKRIARNVKARRLQRGMTLAVAAERAGVHWRHWQKIEAVEVNLTVETLAKLARALGVEARALLRKPPSASRTRERRS